MLQFITKSTKRFSAIEEAQMAIEGGCRWIQLSTQETDDNEETMRDIAQEVIPLCQENEAFLVIEDDVDLVDDLKVHGVFLHDSSRSTVMEARERLGAHAVIGVLASTVDEVVALKGLDVDYVAVALPAGDGNVSMADRYARFLSEIREPGIDFHLVALGEFALEELPLLIEAGCAGVALSATIADSENPVAITSLILETLGKARYGDDADADSVSL